MKSNKGFTLVELLTTIAIIGILSVIAVSSVIKIGNSINEREYNSKIELLSTAAELFAQDHGEIFGVSTEDCPSLVLSEACVRVEDLIQNNYAEIDVNHGDKCADTFGCVINPVDDSSLNKKYFLLKKSKKGIQTEFSGKPSIRYTLTINPVDGEWEGKKTQSLAAGEEIPMEDAIKSGCDFSKWKIEGYGIVNNKKYTMGEGNTILTAEYTCNNKLIIDKNDGINGEETQYLAVGATMTIDNPTKDKCTFEKWNVTGSGTISDTTFTMGDGNSRIRAEYQCTLQSIPYSGAYVPVNITVARDYVIELWGASGAPFSYEQGLPGKGGYTKGTISLNSGDVLYFYVGGEGKCDGGCTTGLGGWNGGGNGGRTDYCNSSNPSGGGSTPAGSGGGGATDVRFGGTALANRIMVAGAGGTRGYNGIRGDAGGLIGYTAGAHSSANQSSTGGTQSSGGQTSDFNGDCGSSGSLGQGGVGQIGLWYYDVNYGARVVHSGDGGGGGYYGGGGSGNKDLSGSGGGSSYISGHGGCATHSSGKTFSNTLMIDGRGYKWTTSVGSLQQMPNPAGGYYESGVGRTGHGYARISYIDK